MQREQLKPSRSTRALYIILALAVAAPLPRPAVAQTAEQRIDLDGNPVNGAESRVVTRVITTFPVQVENTIFNNAGGRAFRFNWPGAGPAGFISSIAPGPDVGTRWEWSSTQVVYTIESPITFTPMLDLPVFGGSPGGGVVPTGGNDGVFIVPGKSIFATQVTLSDLSLASSLITFFSPAETRATCGVNCVSGQCDLFVENLTGETATIRGEQPECCPEPHQIICGGECFSYLEDVENCGGCGNVCGEGEICSGGECMCPEGQTQCGQGCVDLGADPVNCGECGSECLAEQSCVAGICLCPEGETQCGEVCVALGVDRLNCGECGVECLAEQSCGEGACVCPQGETQCSSECVDLAGDPLNCGACANVCLTDESCSTGACVCPGGETQCGAGCVDLGTDESHCGACGVPCTGEQFCYESQCFCLAEGLTNCAGACVDLLTDGGNCGACGNICGEPLVCNGGACGCPGGLSQCGAACVDLLTDGVNCGACGNICGEGQTCSGGTCHCPEGLDRCGEACVDLLNDESNCGECGNACSFGRICEYGVCKRLCDDDDDGGCASASVPGLEAASSDSLVMGLDLDLLSAATPFDAVPAAMPARSGTVPQVPAATIGAGSSRMGVMTSPAARTPGRTPEKRGRNDVPAARRGAGSPRSSGASQAAPRPTDAISVEEAPVCDIAPFEQVIPDGGTFVLSQPAARYGKEVHTTVTIEADGNVIAQGPCPVIVPVTDADTTGVVLAPVRVATVDSSGDGLCQPSEGFCNYFISLDNVGDTACLNPVATLSSVPDEVNTNEVVFLNNTSAYPTWPAWPVGGGSLESQTNQVAFSIATPAEQGSNVGRRFELSVDCANLETNIVAPVVLGIGGTCDPATDLDGESYDAVVGFQSPVSAQLVLEGGPVNYSTKKFSRGSTIPLKVALSCGTQVLGDVHIEPNPEIVAVIHETLGPQPLEGINGHDSANPDDPRFRCDTASCQYQLRTDALPLGVYVISIKMPDSRVFQAGFTIKR